MIIDARNNVLFDGSLVLTSVTEDGIGNGGDIRITTGSLSVTNGAYIDTITNGRGSAGNLIINARESVLFDKGYAASVVDNNAIGNSGDISISTGSLFMANGSILGTANIYGQGNAGNVIINARDTVSFDGRNTGLTSSAITPEAIGNSGDIRITTGSFSLANGAIVASTTFGQGNAGNVIINARDTVSFDDSNVFSFVEQEAVGKGGDIRITTGSLSLTNSAEVAASTYGKGDAGNVSIDARETATRTRGRGDAGNIIINARDRVLLDAGVASSSVEQAAVGKGGDIRMTTNSFQSINGAQLLATTFGQGSAGNIQIKATDSVSVSGIYSMTGLSSALLTINASSNSSKGGDIHIDTPIFHISDGGLLDARTVSNGNGGNILVNAKLFEALNGGQLITTTSGNGRAGKITVNATDRVIVNGSDTNFNQRVLKFPELLPLLIYTGAASGFFVFSSSSGIAGDIEVTSPKVTVDNQGRLSAESASGNGGNINLQVSDLLLLRRDSKISATAGTAQQGGDGGNININSKYIIALREENSDITANAFNGKGGNVQINSQGIFGIEARAKLTDYSDITASSDLGVAGTIALNSPDTSSLRNSLNQLPENVIDTNALLANSCIVRRNNEQGGTFLITGGGGLPERPGDAPLEPFSTGAMRAVSKENESSTTTNQSHPWKIGDPIIEPHGLYQLANGKLVLSRECP